MFETMFSKIVRFQENILVHNLPTETIIAV